MRWLCSTSGCNSLRSRSPCPVTFNLFLCLGTSKATARKLPFTKYEFVKAIKSIFTLPFCLPSTVPFCLAVPLERSIAQGVGTASWEASDQGELQVIYKSNDEIPIAVQRFSPFAVWRHTTMYPKIYRYTNMNAFCSLLLYKKTL